MVYGTAGDAQRTSRKEMDDLRVQLSQAEKDKDEAQAKLKSLVYCQDCDKDSAEMCVPYRQVTKERDDLKVLLEMHHAEIVRLNNTLDITKGQRNSMTQERDGLRAQVGLLQYKSDYTTLDGLYRAEVAKVNDLKAILIKVKEYEDRYHILTNALRVAIRAALEGKP
jgi:hypothetical protein